MLHDLLCGTCGQRGPRVPVCVCGMPTGLGPSGLRPRLQNEPLDVAFARMCLARQLPMTPSERQARKRERDRQSIARIRARRATLPLRKSA